MKKIQLSDENKSILHILTKKEWEEIPNDYKTNYIVDYTKKEIIDKTGMEIETFVHGAMCSSYSGRCVLSNYFINVIN